MPTLLALELRGPSATAREDQLFPADTHFAGTGHAHALTRWHKTGWYCVLPHGTCWHRTRRSGSYSLTVIRWPRIPHTLVFPVISLNEDTRVTAARRFSSLCAYASGHAGGSRNSLKSIGLSRTLNNKGYTV